MKLTQKWLDETLARNPELKIEVQSGKRQLKLKQPDTKKQKYRNKKIYVYESGYASNNKIEPGHGKVQVNNPRLKPRACGNASPKF